MKASRHMGILQVEIWNWLEPNFLNIGLTPTEALDGLDNQGIINW
jgi:hypothetical protein